MSCSAGNATRSPSPCSQFGHSTLAWTYKNWSLPKIHIFSEHSEHQQILLTQTKDLKVNQYIRIHIYIYIYIGGTRCVYMAVPKVFISPEFTDDYDWQVFWATHFGGSVTDPPHAHFATVFTRSLAGQFPIRFWEYKVISYSGWKLTRPSPEKNHVSLSLDPDKTIGTA